MGWLISLAILTVAVINTEPALLVSAGLFAIAGSLGAISANKYNK